MKINVYISKTDRANCCWITVNSLCEVSMNAAIDKDPTLCCKIWKKEDVHLKGKFSANTRDVARIRTGHQLL